MRLKHIFKEKDDVSFYDFILTCARDFSVNTAIRNQPEVTNEEIEEARIYLERANQMSLEDAEREASRIYDNIITRDTRYMKETTLLREKYVSMLEQVKDWEAPTPNHQGLKNYMISQLEESINFDSYDNNMFKPQKQSGAEYKASLVRGLEQTLGYLIKEHDKEVQRAREQTEWLHVLIMSLPKK